MESEQDVSTLQARMSNEEILNEIKLYHAKSAASISLAEVIEGNSNDSLRHYLESMRYCERGLKFTVREEEGHAANLKMAQELQQGMKNTLEITRQKVREMQSFGAQNVATSPPAFDEPPPYSVQDPRGNYGIQSGVSCANAETLLSIENGVQMYFVSDNDNVGMLPPSYPTSLKILLLVDNCQDLSKPQALLQVLDWVYPLAKYQMPVLLSKNGVYIFPNCTENGIQEGSAVGIVISQDVGSAYIEMFESILHTYALFQREDRDEGFADLTDFAEPNQGNEEPDLSDKIANSLKNGAASVARGVKKGAEYATEIVEKGSERLKAKLSPNPVPLSISPTVEKGLHMTYRASNAAVRVSQWLVRWLCMVTAKVIEQLNGRFSPNNATNDANAAENSDLSGIYKVAKASATGLGKIWIELEKAGSAISKAVTTATTTNVEYKYGHQAGQAAGLAMGAAVNFGSTAIILNNLEIKTMAELTSDNNQPRDEQLEQSTEVNGANEQRS